MIGVQPFIKTRLVCCFVDAGYGGVGVGVVSASRPRGRLVYLAGKKGRT